MIKSGKSSIVTIEQYVDEKFEKAALEHFAFPPPTNINEILQKKHNDKSPGIDFRIKTNKNNNYQNYDKNSLGCSKPTNCISSSNGTLIYDKDISKSTYSCNIHNDSVNNKNNISNNVSSILAVILILLPLILTIKTIINLIIL